jgi:hypothetical protein
MSREGYVYLAVMVTLSVLSVGCATERTIPAPAVPAPVAPKSAVNPEEKAIRSVLDDVESAMEERDVYKVLTHVSASYHDKLERDYTDLRGFLQRVFKNYGSIEIARSGTKVTIDENRAAVTETFVTFARGMSGTSVEPLTLRGNMSVFLEKIADRWLIVEWGETS